MCCINDAWSVLPSLSLPFAFYKSVPLEVIAALYYNNLDGVIQARAVYAFVSSK